MAGGQGGTDNSGRYSTTRPGGTGGAGYNGAPGNPGLAAPAANNGGTGGGGGGAGGGVGGAGGAFFGQNGQNGQGGAGGVLGINNGNGGNAPAAPSNGGASGAGGGGGGGGANGLNTAGTLGNTVNLRGGNGGAGGSQSGASGGGGGGGAGGYGAVVRGAGSSTNAGAVQGGLGGAGGGSVQGATGFGGAGGGGGLFTAANSTLANTGTFTGGNGGAGGDSILLLSSQAAIGNAGGQGGAGLSFGSNFTLNAQNGSITGGNGGRGGSGGNTNNYASAVSGNGGVGGVGVNGAGGGAINNAAGISGGNGGAGGTAQGGTAGTPGFGGAGISGQNLTITNTGTVAGGLANAGAAGAARANAIDFTGGTNSLTLGTTATQGTLTGGIGIGGSLSIDTGTAAGTSRTLANQLRDFSTTSPGSVTKVGDGNLNLTGTNTYTGGTTIAGGTLQLGAAGAAGTGAISFSTLSGNATATLSLTQSAQPTNATFTNTLANFGTGSRLDLQGLTNGQVSYNGANTSITVTGLRSGAPVSQTFTVSNPSTTNFLAQDNGQGGTLITVCYVTGTRIRVVRDGVQTDTSVEELRIGDLAVTASGDHSPIRWIGRRTVDCSRHPRPEAVWPFAVAPHAFGPGLPARTLWLSPAHAVHADGLLIQIERLANGTTIRQVARDSVTYWHVELDSHDLLLAEGLEAESYLDTGNRDGFFGQGGTVMLHPEFRPARGAAACMPLAEAGPAVQAVRARLLAWAEELGHAWTSDPDLHVIADGQRHDPVARTGGHAIFDLPEAASVRLVSRTWMPFEATADCEDYRALGVAVWRLRVDGIELTLSDQGAGWHAYETDGVHSQRWTTGNTPLPAGSRSVIVDLNPHGRYLLPVESLAVEVAA